MKNLVANLKNWICDICEEDFQAIEPYRSVDGEKVCKSCQWESLYELDQAGQN